MGGSGQSIINVYCDESCHLEHDDSSIMVLGSVWCTLSKTREIAERLREIKSKHKLKPTFELKWVKVSPSKAEYFQEVLDYFLDDDDLHFRAIVADKTKLDHSKFPGQDHDVWYYKMYHTLLTHVMEPNNKYRFYIDAKDTHSTERVRTLHQFLAKSHYDFGKNIIQRMSAIRSHQVEQAQLVDFLCGIVGYANRGLTKSATKSALVARLRHRTGYALTKSTLHRERKVNIFCWQPQEFPGS